MKMEFQCESHHAENVVFCVFFYISTNPPLLHDLVVIYTNDKIKKGVFLPKVREGLECIVMS